MLTGKQKRFLRSKAHHLTPIFQVGKRRSQRKHGETDCRGFRSKRAD